VEGGFICIPFGKSKAVSSLRLPHHFHTQIGLPNQEQRYAILKGYIHRHHSEMGEQGVSKDLLDDKPGEIVV